MNVGNAGLKLIESFEGFVPFVYDDLRPAGGKYGYREWDGGSVKGTLTIGYGHTNAAGLPKIVKGMQVTQEEGSAILASDLHSVEVDVNRLVKVPLTQNQFDALVSFHFNTGALGKSTLLKKLNAGDYAAVPSELLKWVKSKGQTLNGLIRRRKAEGQLFMKGA